VLWLFTPVFYWRLCCSIIRLIRSVLDTNKTRE
jgi:hypothetical protein